MTASEFAFLALGLVLGVATGAAIVEVLRARPPAPREVRVTVAPASVPTRPSTLANDPFSRGPDGPARGGPGDRRLTDRDVEPQAVRDSFGGSRPMVALAAPALALATAGEVSGALHLHPSRTPVPSAAPDTRRATGRALQPIAIDRVPDAMLLALHAAETRATEIAARANAAVESPPAAGAVAVAVPAPSRLVTPTEPRAAVTVASREPAAQSGAAAAQGSPTVSDLAGSPAPAGPCAELRATAEDRCAVAARAREGAEIAHQVLRESQRAYDDHVTRAEEADRIADPRAVRAAKEAAQQAFRSARDRAGSRAELEAAARTWLATINRINTDARDAAATATRERAAANALVTALERLTVEADAARISAEAAQEACLAARTAVADCEEAAAAAPAIPATPAGPETAVHYPEDEPELTAEAPSEREPRVVRLLQGDRQALLRTVAELAGEDAEERRRWQLALTGLVDAIVAQAIEAAALDIPDEPAFWQPFTLGQRRDIAAALGSLGYRYDGLGGFADGRVPSQRDLSLAVGYAGLDPMRIRRWPTEAEMRGLFGATRVAADDYLVGAAGGLSLSEMVDLLGRRADALTDVWNDWGRVRPRLLAVD